MSKAFLIGIVIFLLGCSAGSLSVDATDYASLCKQAEQEGKNVVVLVTAADCPVCHGLLREWTGCREWAEWQREHVLLCHTALSDTANLFPRLLNTMAVPLVVVVSPDRRIQCPYRFYFGYKIETGNSRDREGACRIVYFE